MRPPSRLETFAWVTLLLVGSIAYSRVLRGLRLSDDLAYVPKESEIVLMSADIASLWGAVDRHFGPILRGEEGRHEGSLYEAMKSLRETLEEKHRPVCDLADLEKYGLDVNGGLIVSSTRLDSMSDLVTVFHVRDRKAFLQAYSDVTGAKQDESTPILEPQSHPTGSTNPEGQEIVSFGDEENYAAFRDDGTASILASPTALGPRRIFLAGRENRRHAVEDDALYDSLRRLTAGRRGGSPALYAFWRPRDLPFLDQAAAALRLGAEEIDLDADIRIGSGGLRILDDFETPPPPTSFQPRYLPARTAAAVMIQDEDVARYIRFADTFAGVREFLEQQYAGALAELRDVRDLHGLVLAITGYHDGVPDILLGLWGNRSDLERVIERLQVRRREERDRDILEGALAAYAMVPGGSSPVTLEHLFSAGVLVPEPGPLFDHARLQNGRLGTSDLRFEDLPMDFYTRPYRGATISYILPPAGDNDVRYVEEFRNASPETIRGDRYRLASIFLDDALWVASDTTALEELVNRVLDRTEDVASNPAYLTARAAWTSVDKLHGFADLDQITLMGLLSPESEIADAIKQSLPDLRNHPAVSFRLAPGRTSRSFSAAVHLFRRSALAEP